AGPNAPTKLGGVAKPQESYAECIKNDGNYFSLQHGLQALTGGRVGNGLLASAFLGNSVSDVIGLFQGDIGGFLTGKAVENGIPAAAKGAAAITPNITVTSVRSTTIAVRTPAVSTTVTAVSVRTINLPLGAAARTSAGLLTRGLEGFGN